MDNMYKTICIYSGTGSRHTPLYYKLKYIINKTCSILALYKYFNIGREHYSRHTYKYITIFFHLNMKPIYEPYTNPYVPIIISQ